MTNPRTWKERAEKYQVARREARRSVNIGCRRAEGEEML